jgi:hypothetical protein
VVVGVSKHFILEQQNMQIKLFVAGKEVEASIPDVFQAIHNALPLVQKFFNNDTQPFFTHRDIHALVGKTYKPAAWVDRVIDRCRLVEGKDYFTVLMDVNDPANAQAIIANKGKVPFVTYFTMKAARKVVVYSDTDDGHMLYDYIDAVAEAATPAIMRVYDVEMAKANAKVISAKNRADNTEHLLQKSAKDYGFNSVASMQLDMQHRSERNPYQAPRPDDFVSYKWKELSTRSLTKIEALLKRKEYAEASRVVAGAVEDMRRGVADELSSNFIGDWC